MSEFDEKLLNRLKLVEREIERLKVWERPAHSPSLRVGVGSYATVTAALAAASDGDTIRIDAGSYAGFTLYPKQFIHIEGSGQPEFDPITGKLIGGTIITGKINLFDSVGSSLNNLGVDVSTQTTENTSNAIDTGSLVQNEQHRLNQRFTHLTINLNPSDDYATNYAHGFRSQGGSHLDISDIRCYGGAHGIAIRASWVNITNCYIEDGLFSAIIIKAIPLTGDAEYVNISDVTCNNTRALSAGGIVLEVWDDSKCRFVNINNALVVKSLAPSVWILQKPDSGGTVRGIMQYINVSNTTSVDCGSGEAPFWTINANDVTFSGCQVINPASTAAFYNDTGTNVFCINEVVYPADKVKAGFKTSKLNLTQVNAGEGSMLTISAGVITPTDFFHVVNTEGAAATDDLTTINGHGIGELLLLKLSTATHKVVLKHSTSLYLQGAVDRTLNTTYDSVLLLSRTWNTWQEIGDTGTKPIQTATPTANAVPIADAAGELAAAWIGTAWAAWTPTQTGWTALPTGVYRWKRVGKLIICSISMTAGTSNGTTAQLSLPVTSATLTGHIWSGPNGVVVNNGTPLTTACRWTVGSNSSSVSFFTDMYTGVWTNSGDKKIYSVFIYESA